MPEHLCHFDDALSLQLLEILRAIHSALVYFDDDCDVPETDICERYLQEKVLEVNRLSLLRG